MFLVKLEWLLIFSNLLLILVVLINCSKRRDKKRKKGKPVRESMPEPTRESFKNRWQKSPEKVKVIGGKESNLSRQKKSNDSNTKVSSNGSNGSQIPLNSERSSELWNRKVKGLMKYKKKNRNMNVEPVGVDNNLGAQELEEDFEGFDVKPELDDKKNRKGDTEHTQTITKDTQGTQSLQQQLSPELEQKGITA